MKLVEMTANELVSRFAELSLEQDAALLRDDIRRINRLFDDIEAIEAELKGRKDDQRTALLTLYTHPNAQVRLKASLATLAVAPNAAREVLQEIIERKEYPQTADARGMLRALDEGRYVPE
jgi:protein-arginine kinase activator protein McsA